MPDEVFVREYERARDAHAGAVRSLVPLLSRLALEGVVEVLPGGHELELLGELNEDWLATLRIQRVLDIDGVVLFDAENGHEDRVVEDVIDAVNTDYLDLLLDLTGDDFMGPTTVRPADVSPLS